MSPQNSTKTRVMFKHQFSKDALLKDVSKPKDSNESWNRLPDIYSNTNSMSMHDMHDLLGNTHLDITSFEIIEKRTEILKTLLLELSSVWKMLNNFINLQKEWGLSVSEVDGISSSVLNRVEEIKMWRDSIPRINWKIAFQMINKIQDRLIDIQREATDMGIRNIIVLHDIDQFCRENLLLLKLTLQSALDTLLETRVENGITNILVNRNEELMIYLHTKQKAWKHLVDKFVMELRTAFNLQDKNNSNQEKTQNVHQYTAVQEQTTRMTFVNDKSTSSTIKQFLFKIKLLKHHNPQNYKEDYQDELEKARSDLHQMHTLVTLLGDSLAECESTSSIFIFETTLFRPYFYECLKSLFSNWECVSIQEEGVKAFISLYFELRSSLQSRIKMQDKQESAITISFHQLLQTIQKEPMLFIAQRELSNKIRDIHQSIQSSFKDLIQISLKKANENLKSETIITSIPTTDTNEEYIVFENALLLEKRLEEIIEWIHKNWTKDSKEDRIAHCIQDILKEYKENSVKILNKWIRKCSVSLLPKRIQDSKFVVYLNTWIYISRSLSRLFCKYPRSFIIIEQAFQFRTLADEYLNKFSKMARSSFSEEFGEDIGFSDISKNEDLIEGKFNEIIKGLNQILVYLKPLCTKYWKTILGECISGVVQLVTFEVTEVQDFASEECDAVQRLMMPLVEVAQDLFSDDGEIEKWIEGFNAYKSTAVIMNLRLVEIPEMFHAGKLPGLSQDVVIHFIQALFTKTPKQEEAIKSIQTVNLL